MKKCNKCGSDFEGRRCNPCFAKYMKDWNEKNPEKVRKIRSKKYIKYKEIIDKKNTEWAKNNREKSNAIKKAYKIRNREKYLSQQREYAKNRYVERREELLEKKRLPERKLVDRAWREENRLILNAESLKRYHKSEEVKIKYRARNKVCRALESGKLVKASECSACGSKGKLQAHHDDYSNALDVTWVCIPCHKKIHSKYLKIEGINPPN